MHFNVEGVEMKLKAIAFRFVNRSWSVESIDSHCCLVNCCWGGLKSFKWIFVNI